MSFLKSIYKKLHIIKTAVTFSQPGKIEEKQQQSINDENVDLNELLMQKQMEIEIEKSEIMIMTEAYDARIIISEEEIRVLCNEIKTLRQKLNAKEEEIDRLKQKETLDILNRKKSEEKADLGCPTEIIMLYKNEKLSDIEKFIQETQYLTIVLELKQNEIKLMRGALMKAKLKEETLEAAVKKVHALNIRCQNLQQQVRKKSISEQSIEQQIVKLKQLIHERNTLQN